MYACTIHTCTCICTHIHTHARTHTHTHTHVHNSKFKVECVVSQSLPLVQLLSMQSPSLPCDAAKLSANIKKNRYTNILTGTYVQTPTYMSHACKAHAYCITCPLSCLCMLHVWFSIKLLICVLSNIKSPVDGVITEIKTCMSSLVLRGSGVTSFKLPNLTTHLPTLTQFDHTSSNLDPI